MNKKKKIILGVVGLVVLIVALSLITNKESEPKEKITDIREKNTFEDFENYKIEKLNDIILVKNENLGFSFEAPGSWRIERYEEEEAFGYVETAKGIALYSPDYSADELVYIESGCEIGVTVFDYTEDESEVNDLTVLKNEVYSYLREEIKERDQRRLIEIDDHYGVGYFLDMTIIDWIENQRSFGEAAVKVPIGDRIYIIGTGFSISDTEKCQEVFRILINSISFSEKYEK